MRFYDRVGLLRPSGRSEAGYRLYSDADLITLQQILALKFLGFSLDEIRLCLDRGPSRLEEVLARQKEMMREKRRQLDAVVEAIESAEAVVQSGRHDWEAIARVIQATQMEQKTNMLEKYFTPEQMATMGELMHDAYGDGIDWQARGSGEWTEADQERASAQWTWVASEADRLAAAGVDPSGEEAQAVAKVKSDLLSAFTLGDPNVEEGLAKFWQGFEALPKAEQPFDASPYFPGPAGAKLLDEAMAIYSGRQAA